MPLPSPPPLSEILPKINLSCKTGSTVVGVYVNVGGKPIEGVNLKLYVASPIPFAQMIELSGKSTNYAGVTGYCVTDKQYAEAWIQKRGMAFGKSSVGGWHKLGSTSGWDRGLLIAKPHVFDYIAAATIGDIPSICEAWNTVSNISLPVQLRPDASFPIDISGAKWECPSLNTSETISNVEGILVVAGRNYNFGILNGSGGINLESVIDISSFITQNLASGLSNIKMDILIPDKDGGHTTFSRQVAMPGVDTIPDPIDSICTAWNTVASPTVPGTLASSFPITVSGAKWVCRDFDDAELIDGMGKVVFDGREFDFRIQGGYGNINLASLIDLDGFLGGSGGSVIPISLIPTIIPEDISPLKKGSTTVTLYLADYIQKGLYTPIMGAYWGAGPHDRKSGYYEIHMATDASGSGDIAAISCEVGVPTTHRHFGDYTVTVLSVQNAGTQNASYTVKIER